MQRAGPSDPGQHLTVPLQRLRPRADGGHPRQQALKPVHPAAPRHLPLLHPRHVGGIQGRLRPPGDQPPASSAPTASQPPTRNTGNFFIFFLLANDF